MNTPNNAPLYNSWEVLEKRNELIRSGTYTIKVGDGPSALANAFWIRDRYLRWVETQLALREWDVFDFSVDNMWKWMLLKSRYVKWVQNIIAQFPLPREAIYQNIETDIGFPNIIYMRIPSSNKYQILFKDTTMPSSMPIFVKTANLDLFRNNLAKASWAFLTECASRNAQSQVMCSIKPIKGVPAWVRLNSNQFLDLIPTNVDLSGPLKYLDPNIDPIKFAELLARSLKLPA